MAGVTTLAGTTWNMNWTRPGESQQGTIKFNADMTGEIYPIAVTFNYTETVKDGQVTGFAMTASQQGFLTNGFGTVSGDSGSGGVQFEHIPWSFTMSIA